MLWSQEENSVKLGYPASFPLAIFSLIIVLLGFFVAGILTIYSATVADDGYHYLIMQVIWITISIFAAAGIMMLPIEAIYRYSHWLLILVAIPLLYLMIAALVVKLTNSTASLRFLPLTKEINGAIRWLKLGPVSIQPSEFAKFIILIFLSAYYGSSSRDKIRSIKDGLIVPGLAAGAVLALIFLGKDLSTTFVTGSMTFAIMYLAGVKFNYLISIMALGIGGVVSAIVTSENRMDRIKAVMDPELYRLGESYQLYRSQLCLGVGGMNGIGYSQGYMKTYLPEQHTDFIVAVIGEEFGLIGTITIIIGYLLIFLFLYLIARQCRDRRDTFICLGIGILIITQAFVNIGVVSGFLPPTGVTAPFLSYGGSSILSLMLGMGLVFNIGLRNHICIRNEIQQFTYTSHI